MGVISKITIITVEMCGFEVLTRGLQVGTLRHFAPREIERNRTKFANLHKSPTEIHESPRKLPKQAKKPLVHTYISHTKWAGVV